MSGDRPAPTASRDVAAVLLAPDKFKGSLTSREVVAALRRGLLRAAPGLDVRDVAVADGGDGTVEAAVAAGWDEVPVSVTGPTGEVVRTSWARRGDQAVVEMADACGLVRLPGGPAPLVASSRGLGEVVVAALEAGVDRIVMGIGGSAGTDGGAGFLAALGARLLDAAGRPLPEGGAALADLARLDLAAVHPRLAEVELVVASDVDNPLLGPHGAAAVYGPQKGAGADDVVLLEAALAHWADRLAEAAGRDHRDDPGAGAAGGVGVAALAVGGRLEPGVSLLLDLVGFDERLEGVDLVVVGEGSLDAQSLRGKAPVGVAAAARAAGVDVVAVCGRRAIDDADLHAVGIGAAHALTDLEHDPQVCVRDAARLLEQLAPRLLAP